MDDNILPPRVDLGPLDRFRYEVLGMSWFVVVNQRPRGGAYVGTRAWTIGPYWGWLSVVLVRLLALPRAMAGLSWAAPEVAYGRFQVRPSRHLRPLERTWTDWLLAGLNLLAVLCSGGLAVATGDYARLAGTVPNAVLIWVCLLGLPAIRRWRSPQA